jgi:hypothetical protein
VGYCPEQKRRHLEEDKSPIDAQLREQAIRSLEENVEENSRRAEWPVYEDYEMISDGAKTYLVARASTPVKKILRPLSRESADLFLRFAGWVEEFGMDMELGSPRNVEAAAAWVSKYGVLGLNRPDMSVLGLVNSRRVTADYLGTRWAGTAVIGHRNTARGGRTEESVENFAFEAWEAHIVLRLYQAVRSQEIVDAESAVRFMSPFGQAEDFPDQPSWEEPSWVERELYSRDPELTRRWALSVVESAVNRKFEDHCYPTIQGAPGSYEQGWGFRSLLGALWLQMMFLMRADRQCWYCGRPIDPGRRKHAKFCDNDGKCRSNWNYENGSGKSSKEKRRQARYAR